MELNPEKKGGEGLFFFLGRYYFYIFCMLCFHFVSHLLYLLKNML